MSTKDHNLTLVGIHVVVGVFLLVGLGAPWLIAGRFLEKEDIPIAVIIVGLVLVVSLLMFLTAFAMYRQSPVGRKLALVSSGFLVFLFWPAAVYSWWFMYTDGAKHMYGVKQE